MDKFDHGAVDLFQRFRAQDGVVAKVIAWLEILQINLMLVRMTFILLMLVCRFQVLPFYFFALLGPP
jgi:hypothetical protein